MNSDRRNARRLVRLDKDRKIAGVCAGFGHYFNVDPVLIRLLWVFLVLCGGSGILIYLIAWIVMPLDRETTLSDPASH